MNQYTCLDLLAQIRAAHQNSPDKVVCTTDCATLSYAELESVSDCIATHVGAMLMQMGCTDLSATVRVGVNMKRTNLLLPTVYALVKLGCTYVPIDLDVPAERRQLIVEDADLKVVLTDQLVQQLLATEPSLCSYQHYIQPEAYIIYTSGTTGRPKGISIGYSGLYHFIRYIGEPERLDFHHDSVLLFFTSINFDVSIIELFGTLFYGASMVVATESDRVNLQKIVSLINNRHVTYASLPTSLLAVMETLDFADLSVLASMGEPIQPSVAERTQGKPYRYMDGYGPTECTVLATLNQVTSPQTCNNLGHALPGVVAYVVDSELHSVQPGQEGELVLGGIQLMAGYVNRPELNEKAMFANPFAETAAEAPVLYHTGDIVRLQEDGTYYYIGRRDNQIKLNGHRIELGEIMHHIASCEGVTAAYVRLESLASEKHLVAYVVLDEAVTTLEFVKHQMSFKMPYYMIPSFWNQLEAFPLNINGKIDTHQLVNHAIDGLLENAGELTALEETIMLVVANNLKVRSVNIDVDLIDEVGLSSLQLMCVQHDVQIAGIDVSVADFYKHRTIRKLAESHKKLINYWYNDDNDPQKPVIVVISGFTDFGYMYYKFAERLADMFSIFVIESYHAVIGKRATITALEMMDLYQDLLADVNLDRIVAFMGVCLGGEHAMLLAHTLYKDRAVKPAAIVLDGEVLRDCDETKNAQIFFPYFTPEENLRRNRIDNELMRTTPDFHYQGRLGVFLCSVFIDYWSMLDPDMTERKTYWMKRFFETNPERWRQVYPEADLTMLPANHCDFWLTDPSLSIITDYIKALV